MPDLKPFLAKVATGESLTREEAHDAFGILMSGEATPSQIGGFLMALRVRGETVAEMTGAVSTMRAKMLRVEAPADAVDIVGTGGDGAGTYNISTLASIIAAGAGLSVAKHGNRALSSKSGTADALSALGVNLEIGPNQIARCIREAGIGFMFASMHHAAMRHVGPSRVELGTRTIFNLLGPLSNPAGAKRQLLGVYSPQWLMPIAETLRVLGYQRAAVVHSGGMDEISLHAPTLVAELNNGEIKSYQLEAADFGLTPYHQAQLAGGTPEENRDILTRLLQGKGEPAHEAAVAANVAMLMRLHGEEDLQINVQKVMDVLRSGAAYDRVTALAARG